MEDWVRGARWELHGEVREGGGGEPGEEAMGRGRKGGGGAKGEQGGKENTGEGWS